MILDYLKIFPKTFPLAATRELLKLSEFQPHYAATVSEYGREKINNDYRVVDTIELPDDIEKILIKGILDFSNAYLLKYYNHEVKSVETPQFLRYNVGGKYDVHNDSEDLVDGKITRLVDRDITILAYINDNYEGGELEFPEFGISLKPKAGTVVTFPSYYEFKHRVRPVTNGKRYCLTTWIETKNKLY